MKAIHLTKNCDMVAQGDEIYYFIHEGENDGVSFSLVDLKVSHEDGKYKVDYQPVILTNPYNAPVNGIYDEIHEVAQKKFKLYLETIKG